MNQIEIKMIGIFFLILGVTLLIYKAWDWKTKKIHRPVPIKDWKIISLMENFGLPRHELITPEKHFYIYWFIIIRDIILAIGLIIIGLLFILWGNPF